jgi:glycosyltransferase involved in cell wall biosynthesis
LHERALRHKVAAAGVGQVIQIQDLGVLDLPYFVVQDLNYDLLLDNFGDHGVPHFRHLTRDQMHALRERQHRIYASAAGLLPMSRWLADRLVAGGADPAVVHVVNPGVNAPLDPEAPLQDRRVGRNRKLLFIGRDFDTKGGDQLVAAFELLRATYGPLLTLTIAGPKSWPLRTPPGPGIAYIGPVPVRRVQQLYDTHDLFVMPSRFEGFGIAFVEALVRGLPCIGRRACAMPEIISEDSGGRLISTDDPTELAQTIVDALADDALYQACAEAAAMRRAHFTWDRAARQIHDVVTD